MVDAGVGAPELPIRLFVAVWPPPEVTARLAALPRPATPGVRWEPADLAHVTLRFIGHADPAAVIAALEAAPLPRAEAVVGPTVSRLGRSVLCVPVAGLDRLATEVVDATSHLGEPPPPRRFAGHVTLARLRNRAACGLAGHRLSASFEVTEVALVCSHLPGTPGAVAGQRAYETMARFPLGRREG